MEVGSLQFLNNWFSALLQFFFSLTNNYGAAIILLTLAYKVVLIPLSYTQRKSMFQLKEIAPLQKAIQEKYKDDPQEANKKIMEMYKEHNANPFSGCLIALLQLPILFILNNVLRSTDYAGYGFLWISDLTRPDIILALVSGVISYLQMSMETTEENKTTSYTFPVFITIMGFYLPAGLSLYFAVSYILSYFEILAFNKIMKKNKVRVEGGAQNND